MCIFFLKNVYVNKAFKIPSYGSRSRIKNDASNEFYSARHLEAIQPEDYPSFLPERCRSPNGAIVLLVVSDYLRVTCSRAPLPNVPQPNFFAQSIISSNMFHARRIDKGYC